MTGYWISFFLLLLTDTSVLAANKDTAFLFISPQGRPDADGSVSRPLPSLPAAVNFCRQHPAQLTGKKSLVLFLRKGEYRLTESIILEAADAAAFQHLPVTITSYGTEFVALNGGISIEQKTFSKITDRTVLAALPTGTASQVRQISLPATAGPEMGKIVPFGFQRPILPTQAELFFGKQPMQLARYPNDTAAPIVKAYPAEQKIGYSGSRPQRWVNATNAWIGGFFAYAWADDAVPLKQVDIKNNTLTLGLKPIVGIAAGADFNRWYAFNLLEELDAPGEYFIDVTKRLIYFYPFPGGGDLEISLLTNPMIVLDGVSDIRFQNITFENTRGNAASVSQCRNVVFDHCTFRNIGLLAISFGNGVEPFQYYIYDASKKPTNQAVGSLNEYLYHNTAFDREAGTGNGLNACHIYNTGNGGVSLGGGDRKTLTAAGNYVQYCDIHHCNRLGKTYKAAINIDGAGNRASNNHLHHTSQTAIYLHGNDHTIEGNEIDHCCPEADDMAALYMGYDPSEVGNSFTGNYFHDILPKQPGYFVAAMFFDDGASNMTVANNIFYKTGTAGFGTISLNGSFGFDIKNNLFLNCPQAIRLTPWDTKKWNQTIQSELWQNRLYRSADVKNTAYTTKYPWLRSRLQVPVASLAENNVAVNASAFANEAIQQQNNCITTALFGLNKGIPDFEKLLRNLTCTATDSLLQSATWKTAGIRTVKPGNPFDPYQ